MSRVGFAASTVLGVALGLLPGCAWLSTAPTVPITPANSAQVSSCQTTAGVHNGGVLAGVALGAAGVSLGSVAAADSDQNAKTTLGITTAIVAGVDAIAMAVTGLEASNFQNSNCSSVIGALPETMPASAPSPADAGGGG